MIIWKYCFFFFLSFKFSIRMRAPWTTSTCGSKIKACFNSAFGQSYASNFVETLWERPFSILAWLCHSAQIKVYKDMVGWAWCGRTWVAHTEPWPQPIKHLWDDQERKLRARPSHPASVLDLTNNWMNRQNFYRNPS